MQVRWKRARRLRPSVVIGKLLEIAHTNDEGNIVYEGFEFLNLTAALEAMLEFSAEVAPRHQRMALSRGLSEVLRAGSVTPDALLEQIRAQLRTLLATRMQRYYLLSSISIRGAHIHKSARVQGSRLRFFDGEYPEKYISRAKQEHSHSRSYPVSPRDYRRVIVGIDSRNPHHAGHRALAALDLYRALLCIFVNPALVIVRDIKPAPLNRVVLGPIHTIHYKSGRICDESEYYYEPYLDTPRCYVVQPDKSKTLQKNIEWATSRIEASNYAETLRTALLQFVRAFDERSAHNAGIRMWSALETLSGSRYQDYEVLVKRCSFVAKDDALHGQYLQALREYRNRNVHQGEEIEESYRYCFLMQRCFYWLLLFLLKHADFFRDIDEVCEFLDLPSQRTQLERQHALLERAVQFRD